MPEPLDRVRAFVEERTEQGIDTLDVIWHSATTGVALTTTDLRDVVSELDECYSILIDIDTILDEPLKETSFARLERIRAKLGNHRGKDI